jgi:mRNA-degrading endonuclease YafQ of YafQ-DinJ toxin-antitoxin module
MQIRRSSQFDNQYGELSRYEQKQVDATLELFAENPFDPSLDNHALTKRMTGLRSIKAAVDLCLIFSLKGDYVEILFLAVGKHSEVYF